MVAPLDCVKADFRFRHRSSTCDVASSLILTPWCRVLLERLTGLQLVKKFPAFHETRTFITALTSVRHLSLCWASPIQSTCPHPTSWRSILILSTHLRLGLPSGLLPTLLFKLSLCIFCIFNYHSVLQKHFSQNIILLTR